MLLALHPFETAIAYRPVGCEYDHCQSDQKSDLQRYPDTHKQCVFIPFMRWVPVDLAVKNRLFYPPDENRDPHVEHQKGQTIQGKPDIRKRL